MVCRLSKQDWACFYHHHNIIIMVVGGPAGEFPAKIFESAKIGEKSLVQNKLKN
jgi:hypothetical protein